MVKDSIYSKHIQIALHNDPPGEWMPHIPKDCIRLSSGFPDPEVMPVNGMKRAVTALLEEENEIPLHYLGTPKMDELKGIIQTRMSERGMDFQVEELLVTAGACQAIDLVSRVLIDEDTLVAVEQPTYMEALEVFQNYTKAFLELPMDADGMQTDVLEAQLTERKEKGLPLPKFVYTIPSFHNPTGTTMTEARRQHLLLLAKQFDFLILEDDAYGELYFGNQPTPIKAMDESDRVIYVGSFSKVVAPGIRIGWVANTKAWMDMLFQFKKDLDHPFAQAIMATYLQQHPLSEKLPELKAFYKEKSEAMLQALTKYMPEHVSWYVPKGGYFIWVKVTGADTSLMLEEANKQGISYLPGKYFFLDQSEACQWLRLSFSYATLEDITTGVKKLSEVIRAFHS